VTNSGGLGWISIVCLDEVIGLLPVFLSLLVLSFGLVVKLEFGNMAHEFCIRLAQVLGLELGGIVCGLDGKDGTGGDAGGNNTGNTDLD